MSPKRPNRSLQYRKTGRCPRCLTVFDGSNALTSMLCCLGGEPKNPPECLWCGESLKVPLQCFCNKRCSNYFHEETVPVIRGKVG